MSTRPLLKESLFFLNILGLDPHNQNIWSVTRMILAIIFIMGLGIECLLQCVFYWDGLNSMDSVSILMGTYQLLFRMSVAVINRKTFKNLVDKMNNFWPTDKFGVDVKEETDATFTSIKKIANYVFCFLVAAIMVYFLKPFFSSVRMLPYHTYHPTDLDNLPSYSLMFLSQFVVICLTCCLLMGFDGLFVSFVIHINCEFKMIKKGFKEMPINRNGSEDETLKALSNLIDQHNLVLGCIQNLNYAYYVFLLNYFLANMFCICVGLLCIVAEGNPPSLDALSKHGSYVLIHILQLFFYCIMGSRLIIESESLSNAVYDVNWWLKTQPRVRRALALVIQRANRAEYLTAGGMFVLDLESYSNLIRTALSFFTFMEAVYEEADQNQISYLTENMDHTNYTV